MRSYTYWTGSLNEEDSCLWIGIVSNNGIKGKPLYQEHFGEFVKILSPSSAEIGINWIFKSLLMR